MPAKQAINRYVFLSKPSAVPCVDVLLNGRKVGGMQFSVNDGWRFLPGGKVKNAGDWFPTFEAAVADITGVKPEPAPVAPASLDDDTRKSVSAAKFVAVVNRLAGGDLGTADRSEIRRTAGQMDVRAVEQLTDVIDGIVRQRSHREFYSGLAKAMTDAVPDPAPIDPIQLGVLLTYAQDNPDKTADFLSSLRLPSGKSELEQQTGPN